MVVWLKSSNTVLVWVCLIGGTEIVCVCCVCVCVCVCEDTFTLAAAADSNVGNLCETPNREVWITSESK